MSSAVLASPNAVAGIDGPIGRVPPRPP